MDETESQIAKIILGNNKSSNTYVYAMAEKAPAGNAELYVVAELPMLNPAAAESCERICLAVGSTLKRTYNNSPQSEAAFENSISQINEELGKLASMGQTDWIYKLNCILAVKDGNSFHIASCGKVSAYLLRGGEFTDISCQNDESHPLKTFEHYASGKLRLGDLLLLSNTQLFNFLSMDRIFNILENNSFLLATQTIIQLLKDGADSQTSFGALLNLQVQPGQVLEESVDLENYLVEDTQSENIFTKILSYLKTVFAMDKSGNRKPKTDLPKVSFGDRMKNISGGTKNLLGKTKSLWRRAQSSAKTVKETVNKENFDNLSPVKKFFFASLLILLITLVGCIFVAVKVSKNNKTKLEISAQLNKAQTFLDSAQSSLLYKEYNAAGGYITKAKEVLPSVDKISSTNKDQYSKIIAQLITQQKQMEREVSVEIKNLGSLVQGDRLIRLPNYTAVQAGNTIISYNIQTGQIQDSQLSAGVSILGSVFTNDSLAVIYDGSNLYMWDFLTSKISPGFSQSLPDKNGFAGMAYYPTNNRVYVADKKNSRIVNFVAGKNGVNKPVVVLSNQSLSNAQDMALDGAIYVLTSGGLTKFQNGKLAEFNFPQMPTPYSGKGKVYTDKASKNVYILDEGNNRVIVTDKVGNLVYSFKSDQFTKLTDFMVNEQSKIMYILNDGSLLKATLP